MPNPRKLICILAWSLMYFPASGTTVAIIWTPQEIVVAADSAVLGEQGASSCKIRQVGNTFFAFEGVAQVNATTNGKPNAAISFDVIPWAQRAAKKPGTIADKARDFEGPAKQAFQGVANRTKKNDPVGYKAFFLHPHPALQVIFFGKDPGKSPAYALISFDVWEDAHGEAIVTSERGFCPGKDCGNPDTRILGEGKKADELSKRPGFSTLERTVAVRSLVEAEVQDKPRLVKPPIDVVRLSPLGTMLFLKPRCDSLNEETAHKAVTK